MDETSFRLGFLNRTLPFITEKGEARLRDQTVAIAGCGGVGGIVCVTLARMGVGNFRLADPGKFDLPDMNRQMGATTKTLGRLKTEVYSELVRDVNPHAGVKLLNEGVNELNVDAFVSGTDVLVDCLDLSVTPHLRGRMFAAAKAKGVYAISAPVIGFGSIIVGQDPDGMSMEPMVRLLEKSQGGASFPELLYRFFMPEHLDLVSQWLEEKKTKVPSIALSPLVASSIVVTEVLNALIGDVMPGGRRPLALPQIALVDLFRMSYAVVNAEVLLNAKEGKPTPHGARASR